VAEILTAPTWLSLEALEGVELDRDYTVFDAYLDGTGLVFYESPEARASKQTSPLRAPRQDVGNNPFEQLPDFGDYFAQGSFAGGSGQVYFHRPERDETRYMYSEGFDIQKDGSLIHLHRMARTPTGDALITAPRFLEIFDDVPYTSTGDDAYFSTTALGAWTATDPGSGTQTLLDATTNGQYLYVAAGSDGIHRLDTAGAWTHSHVTGTVQIVEWAKDRLIAAANNLIYEIVAGGALPSHFDTLPAGWVFTSIFESGAFIFATAVNTESGLSRIYAYALNAGASALERKTSTPMPRGEKATSGLGYLGRTFIGGGKINSAGGYNAVFYQAEVDSTGNLSLDKVAAADGEGTEDLSVTCFEVLGDRIVFGWSVDLTNVRGRRVGLAAYNLARNAFYHHLAISSPSADLVIRGIRYYRGRVLVAVDGTGVFNEDLTLQVAAATLETSVADWNNAGYKVWDRFEVAHTALPSGASIQIDYSNQHPDDQQWVEVIDNTTPGSTGIKTTDFDVKVRRLGLRIISSSTSDGTDASTITGFTVRSAQAPDVTEWVLKRFVLIADSVMKQPTGVVQYLDPSAVLAQLEATAYSRVTWEEPDGGWDAFVQEISHIRPVLPEYEDAQGESSKDVHVVALTMIGSRT
jgi:hypothetical protein